MVFKWRGPLKEATKYSSRLSSHSLIRHIVQHIREMRMKIRHQTDDLSNTCLACAEPLIFRTMDVHSYVAGYFIPV